MYTPVMKARARSQRQPTLVRLFKSCVLTVPIWLAPPGSYANERIPRVAYYGAKPPEQSFRDYDVVVLDSDYTHSIAELLEDGKIVLAYLSAGEVSKQRPYFADAQRDKYLLDENKNWPGSYKVDLRDKRWTERIVQDLIPDFLRAGFSGVFLDTLDSAIELENNQPATYRGMRVAASRLVQTIRHNYPQIKIMVNRAYEIVPDFGDKIDFILGESVYTSYDFSAKHYVRLSTQRVDEHVALLQDLQTKYKNLQVMTLDYWDPEDPVSIAEIYSLQSQNGFSPYVASIGLDRIVPKPDGP
jgi:polysaccharide biosynthesis protein PelA